jgi:folate-dependent phosphoribosylglycinamide formyltransferase PurN/GNAT superfamily N-acetyltransferase
VHHALEALGARGILPLREHRVPERILSWIDAEFGGTASLDAATGGIWIAQDDSGPLAFAAYDVRGLEYHWLDHWSQRPSTGTFGPFGVAPRARGTGIGSTLLAAAMFSLAERGYREALIPAVAPADVAYFERNADALRAENVDLGRSGRRWRATVLASGHGGNLQSVIDASLAGELPLDITGVVVNRPGAYAIERATKAGIRPTVVAWNRAEEARADYDARVIAAVAQTQPDLVLLLGWMHVLPPAFVERFPQALNLHPAFLPLDFTLDAVTMPDGSVLSAYRGAHAFEDALRDGGSWSGATVHRVNAAVDRGEVFARLPLRLSGETRSELEGRLAQTEREVVKTAIRHWTYRRP